MKRKELEDNGKFLGTYRLKDGLYNVPDGECDIYLMDGNVYGVCNRKNSFSYNGKVKDTVFIGQFEDLINKERDREENLLPCYFDRSFLDILEKGEEYV